MSGSRALLAVPVVLAAVLGLAGCRAAERTALPAVPSSSGGSSSHGSRTTAATDPLAGVEATVDAVEHDVDADAGSDSGSDSAAGR
jgi:hypothetical protein